MTRKRKKGGGFGIGGKIGRHAVAAGIVWKKLPRKRKRRR